MAYKASYDRMLFITVSLLTTFGLVMLYSASSVLASTEHGMSSYYFVRQSIFAVIGFALMLFLMNIDYRVWRREKLVRLLVVASLLSLVLVLTQPPVNGARRWLHLGSLSTIQPSESAKLVILIFLAAFLDRHASEINHLRQRLLPCLAVVAVFGALIVVEPDLGQLVCVGAMTSILLFTAGLSLKYIGCAFCAIIPVFYFLVVRVPFRWGRIQTFLDPLRDPLGAGWQISQSLTAVGSGGIAGVGLGASKQKLFFLPEAHSDFIYAVIGEELGLIGTVLVALAFAFLFYRGMKIALKAPDTFGFYLALGITVMVVVQALINFSTVLALMPAKGTALPFISQGGTSLLLNLAASGILLNVSQFGERA
jgi:cell division protein FtsW